MQTVPADFTRRAALGETDKVVVAHLYYSDSAYLKLSNVPLVISDVQYLPCINNVISSTHRWNILEDNNTTSTNPTLELVDYYGQGSTFSISSEFNSKTYRGFKMVIYVGYRGQTIAQMLKMFDGTIDNVSLNLNSVSIAGVSNRITKTRINGRKVDYVNDKIGDDALAGTIDALPQADGKFLPIPFGKHWCAPALNYAYNSNTLNYLYGINDNNGTYLTPPADPMPSGLQGSIDNVDFKVLIANDGAYVPLYSQGFGADDAAVYSYQADDGTEPDCILLNGPGDDPYHFRSDDQMFVNVPLRLMVEEVDHDVVKTQVTDIAPYTSDAALENVFWGDWSNLGFNAELQSTAGSALTFYVNGKFDIPRSYRSTIDGSIYPSHKINVPSTTDNDDGRFIFMARTIFEGNAAAEPVFSLKAYCWHNSYYPDIGDDASADVGLPYYIGDTNIGFDSGNSQTYNQNSRIFGYNVATVAGAYLILPAVTWANWAGDIGTEYIGAGNGPAVTTPMGTSPELNRKSVTQNIDGDAFARGVGCRIQGVYTQQDDAVPLYVQLQKLYGVYAGAVANPVGDYLYLETNGATLDTGTSLRSTFSQGADYQLKRPYEYINYLMAWALGKNGVSDFGGNFAQTIIGDKWDDFFSTYRDNSGFVIWEDLNLDDFIKEYVKYEPFTVVADSGLFDLPMLQKTYTEGSNSINGTVYFDDFTKYSVTQTPSRNIVAEIGELKTNHMYGLDDYAIKINWAIPNASYDYDFYLAGNTYANNSLKLPVLEKKYTSYTALSKVVRSGKYYTCSRTHYGVDPATDAEHTYWREMTPDPLDINNYAFYCAIWEADTVYYGEDAESREIAWWYLNQWANPHNIINFSTTNMEYMKYQLGDVIEFSGVPDLLFGEAFKGFGGGTTWEISKNLQGRYACFIITEITKSMKEVRISAMQCHNLTAYVVERK